MSCIEGTTITVKKGEIKTLKFTFTNNGAPVDITSATLTVQLKVNIDDVTPALTIADGDFTKNLNIATATLDTSTLTEKVKYLAEIKAEITATSLDKSETFFVDVLEPVVA